MQPLGITQICMSEKVDYSKEMVENFFEELRHALEHGQHVKLSGFGNFTLRDKPERPGRNPKTGEEIEILHRRFKLKKMTQIDSFCLYEGESQN